MIRNIVFDMGKVLVDYDPDRVCDRFMDDPQEKKEVKSAVFDSQEWVLLDMGVISEDLALKKMQSRLDTDHKRRMAALCFEHWHTYNMTARPAMADLIHELKAKGLKVYLCSNASVRLLTCYQTLIPAIEVFDGVLFSAEVRCIKPQKEIYQHLFSRFDLKPEECFFIDDLDINIEGSRACGMDGYCFDGDIDKLRKVLSELN